MASLFIISGLAVHLRVVAANKAAEAHRKTQELQSTTEQKKAVETERVKVQEQKAQVEQTLRQRDEEVRTKQQEIDQLKQSKANRVRLAVATTPAPAPARAVAKPAPKPVARPVAVPASIARRLGQGAYGPNTYSCRPIFQCTCYAKSKRPDLPSSLGNANTWASRARALGWAVGHVAVAGAVGQKKVGNHVVYIENVNTKGTANPNDDTVYLSERNYDYRGSFRYRYAAATDFIYIY